MKKSKVKQIVNSAIFSIIIAIVGTILLSYCFGFRAFLVKGWSSEPYIPYNSLIIDYKHTSFNDLEVGDFITLTNTGKNFITHRIVAIKKDGYFSLDEQVTIYKDGKSKTFTTFSEINSGNNVTNCNIITQQMTRDDEGIDSTCELINYQNNFTGKVVKIMPVLGKTVNFIRNYTDRIIVAIIILYLGMVFFKFTPDYNRLF